jgi:hypothetical protein
MKYFIISYTGGVTMPQHEIFSTIQVPVSVRRRIKLLSAQLEVPMYQLVQGWLEAEERAQRQPQTTREGERAQGA